MWWTLVVAGVSVVFLWREVQAVRRGASSRRQLVLRAIGCVLLLMLALVLQFREAILPGAGETSSGARLLRLTQFLVGVFVLVMALVLVALLDARETLRRYVQERRRMVDDLVAGLNQAPPPSSDGKRDENTL
ncbi:MAG: hypothetical protein HPY54_11485 [Chthonomonadetes bacterium]|nr:hypothetical protein [Chthonomonadetes bacterium]